MKRDRGGVGNIFRSCEGVIGRSTGAPVLLFGRTSTVVNGHVINTRGTISGLRGGVRGVVLRRVRRLSNVLVTAAGLTRGVSGTFRHHFLCGIGFRGPSLRNHLRV